MMSRPRKQKLSARPDGNQAPGPPKNPPPLQDSLSSLNLSALALSREGDPFLLQGFSPPPKFNLSSPDIDALGLDISPSRIYNDDDFISTFMDIVDSAPLREDSFCPELLSPTRGLGSGIGSKESFQDLRFTSTPKASLTRDSGIGCHEDSISNKRMRTTSETSYAHVLHDITDSNKLNNSCDSSFISLSQQLNNSSTVIKEEETENVLIERRISIIRKDLTRKIIKEEPQQAVTSDKKVVKEDESSKEELIYYTGISNYSDAVALLKHIKLPTNPFLSTFKMQLLTLTKLKLDLEWKDLAFRFRIKEDTVKEIFSRTVRIMSQSLSSLLPWTGAKKGCAKKLVNGVFVYPLYLANDTKQILLFLTDAKKPVVHISKCWPGNYSPLATIAADCARFGVDSICVHDPKSEVQSNYRLVHERSTGHLLVQDSLTPAPAAFLESCLRGVDRLLQYKMLLSKQNCIPDRDYEHMTLLSACITNFNCVKGVTNAFLKEVYGKSCDLLK